MSTKRFKELKNLSKEELMAKIRELEANLFQARMKRTTGQLENVASLWSLRKDLARAKTLQTQKFSGQKTLTPEAPEGFMARTAMNQKEQQMDSRSQAASEKTVAAR